MRRNGLEDDARAKVGLPSADERMAPSDAEGGFATASIFQVRRVRSPAALEFTLAQAMAVLDSHQIARPAIPGNVLSFLPCTVLITVRQDTATGERTGLLRFIRNDGAGCLEQTLEASPGATRIEIVPFRGTAWHLR